MVPGERPPASVKAAAVDFERREMMAAVAVAVKQTNKQKLFCNRHSVQSRCFPEGGLPGEGYSRRRWALDLER